MNLTLYLVTPSEPDVRPIYILSPNVEEAARTAGAYVPRIHSITAMANNAYVADTFPRFIGWPEFS